ncbi:MAG: cytochrome c oxidase subunit II [Longimicrobiales bacterium]|nr:cytochrome c oxidase subunit II [Longimicrobiales bacterium]
MASLATWTRVGFQRVLPLAALVLLVTACGVEYPQSSISPRTDFADIIHSLYTNIFWWTVLIGALVWVLMGYILVRFREKPDQERPKQNHGHLGLEIGWTIGPALIVVAIAIPTIQAVFATQPDSEEIGEALLVDVIGHRFWWEFQYPESGVVTANELHVPVDRPVRLRLQSADVIHSFWVPMLGGKRDVNPIVQTPEGEDPRYSYLHFTPYETGTFMGQCAEFCGLSHSLMGTRVVVESEDDFQAWQDRMLNPTYSDVQLPAQAQAEPADPAAAEDAGTEALSQEEELIARGRQVFFEESYCVLCHAVNGTPAAGAIGPDLTNLGERGTIAAGMMENTRENLVEWIRDPNAFKPGVNMPGAQTPAPREGGGEWQPTNLDEEQLQAVAAYLASLDGR